MTGNSLTYLFSAGLKAGNLNDFMKICERNRTLLVHMSAESEIEKRPVYADLPIYGTDGLGGVAQGVVAVGHKEVYVCKLFVRTSFDEIKLKEIEGDPSDSTEIYNSIKKCAYADRYILQTNGFRTIMDKELQK